MIRKKKFRCPKFNPKTREWKGRVIGGDIRKAIGENKSLTHLSVHGKTLIQVHWVQAPHVPPHSACNFNQSRRNGSICL